MIRKAIQNQPLTETGRKIKKPMATNIPYQALVDGFARLLTEGEAFSPSGLIPRERPSVAAEHTHGTDLCATQTTKLLSACHLL
jgi:hypothetical protein